MTIIVDANILFSALITPAGKIGDLITHPTSSHRMVTCHYAFVELFKHQSKIVKYSRQTEAELVNILDILLRNIEFHNEMLIDKAHMLEAERLTKLVDHFDMRYVALALQTGGILWTGDKKLATHLKTMKFDRVVNTAELSALLNIG
jgi:predicted nucleic acid-binding protein